MYRIGHGYDVHRLVEEAPLLLGGVRVPAMRGAVGHSDADVLIHALCDALLGALALGDIGTHFSDKDPKYKGIDSTLLLDEVVKKVTKAGYKLVNMDGVVALQRPLLRPHIRTIRATLAKRLGVALDTVSVKATTTEGLGFVGRKEGIEASVVVLLEKSDAH